MQNLILNNMQPKVQLNYERQVPVAFFFEGAPPRRSVKTHCEACDQIALDAAIAPLACKGPAHAATPGAVGRLGT
jgi:hypothetical protein